MHLIPIINCIHTHAHAHTYTHTHFQLKSVYYKALFITKNLNLLFDFGYIFFLLRDITGIYIRSLTGTTVVHGAGDAHLVTPPRSFSSSGMSYQKPLFYLCSLAF